MSKEKYSSLYSAVYARPRLVLAMELFSSVASVATAIVYALFLVGVTLSDAVFGIKLLAVTAIPFLLVTLVRHLVNAPRPYEVLDCPQLARLSEKGRAGHGFPSRHAASSAIVGTALCFLSPFVGISVLALGVALGACRVLLGRHFLRDVLAGGAIGAVSGIVGMLIVNV